MHLHTNGREDYQEIYFARQSKNEISLPKLLKNANKVARSGNIADLLLINFAVSQVIGDLARSDSLLLPCCSSHKKVRRNVMNDVKLLIDNQDVNASNNRTFERKNPVTGEVATVAAAANAADARKAADAAAAAFPEWSKMGPGARRKILLKAADIMEAKGDQFGQLVLDETGSTRMWGGFNAHLAANMLREAGGMTTQIQGDIIPSDTPGLMAMGIRQPVGVVLGIAPWNAPVILGTRAIAMPLACGNTVILKASELCPALHRLIGECLVEAGRPRRCRQCHHQRPGRCPGNR